MVNIEKHFGTYKNYGTSMKLTKIFLKLWKQKLSGFIFVLLLNRFPFVDNNHHRSTFFNDSVDKLKIVNFKRRISIHNIDNNMRWLNVEHCTDLRFSEIFFLILCYSWGVESCSVNKFYFSVFVKNFGCKSVTGSMWDVRNDHFFFLLNKKINLHKS